VIFHCHGWWVTHIKLIGEKMEINLLDIFGLIVFGVILGGFYYFMKKD
jgi:hypothetical protein